MFKVIDPSTDWSRTDPPERKWVLPGMIPAGRLTLCSGDGGTGKTLLAQQLATAVTTGTSFLGRDVSAGGVVALFGEDDKDELHRRQVDINTATSVEMPDLHEARYLSGVEADCTLWTTKGKPTPLLTELVTNIKDTRPAIVILDNAAAVFQGNELSRPEVTAFCRALERDICHASGAAVFLLAHPSASGMASGRGYSGSTAWNAAVRSRLYLTRPGEKDPRHADSDARILSVPKANYAKAGAELELRWRAGVLELVQDASKAEAEFVLANLETTALRILAGIVDRGEAISPHGNQSNYVVTILKRHPTMQGQRRDTLEDVYRRLKEKGDLVLRPYGRKGHETQRVYVAPHVPERLAGVP